MLHVTIEGSIVTSLLFTFVISVLYLKTWVVQKNKVISNCVLDPQSKWSVTQLYNVQEHAGYDSDVPESYEHSEVSQIAE